MCPIWEGSLAMLRQKIRRNLSFLNKCVVIGIDEKKNSLVSIPNDFVYQQVKSFHQPLTKSVQKFSIRLKEIITHTDLQQGITLQIDLKQAQVERKSSPSWMN
jgi:hypothetical protein